LTSEPPAARRARGLAGLAWSAVERLTEAANGLGSLWILGLMFLVVGDVLGRAASGALFYLTGAVVNLSIRGTPELVKLSIVGIVFLQLGHTLRLDRHVRSTVVIDRVGAGARETLSLAAHLAGAGLCALIAWSSWDTMVVAWQIGEYEGEGALRVPVAPSRTLIVVGSVLLGLQFARLAAGNLRRLVGAWGRAPGAR